jgi:CRP-like cAMP-binding protein
MSGLDFLKDVDSFQGLTDKQLKELQAGCRQIEFQQGERVFEEGETAEHLWVVKQGTVDLRFELPGHPTSEENTISSAGPQDTLGYSSFVPPFKYKLSAYCTSRTCNLVKIEKTYLLGLFEHDPAFGFRVISNLAGVASSHFNQLQRSATAAPPHSRRRSS